MPLFFQKHVSDIKDYQSDWTLEMRDGDAIAYSTWVVPPDLSVVAQTTDGIHAMVVLSDGVVGQKYSVRNIITTVLGRTEVDDLTILIIPD